ncbi:MAG: alanine--glyoxylate aminotransferase family protein [Eubacterium sp.]|nr:alanine--glyoxylate aminotransferase family protein [Candidatus Colimonas fimequi]
MAKLMTAGPTQVRENVRMARSLMFTNPDVDPQFAEDYKVICDKLEKIMNCSGRAYIMDGEGILGLEAACASLTEPGDRVLVLDNGIFGRGFDGFISMYGGEPVLFTKDYTEPFTAEELRAYLEKDHDFKYATLVHCDTPSGMLNPIDELCPILAEYGILTVVDSVAAMFGEPVDFDGSQIDILCGGSQKALSAPPGLTMVWVSDKAMAAMEGRNTPIASFYANILTFKTYYEDKWFPYTMPISDIMGLAVAVDNYLAEEDPIGRHARIANACRTAVTEAGLHVYVKKSANTVTVFEVPEGVTDTQILDIMKNEFGIMITGSFDVLAGKVLRIGHMGENANEADMIETLNALQGALTKLGVPVECDMVEVFKRELA